MADDTTQRAAHRFFSERLQTLEPFTKEDVSNATGWSVSSLETYWSKQFKGLLEIVDDTHYRVRERFRLYLDWKKFKSLVTQVKTVPPSYAPTVFDDVIVYEFYMPLAHESTLRITLDSLFYKDAILPRIRRIGVKALKQNGFDFGATETELAFFERVCKFVEAKFGGYSIYHVDGRFRSGKLATQQEASEIQKSGQRYLVDETTAVTRFIFPCKKDEPAKVRLLFKELFINAITDQVSGEDEIWVVETGIETHVHIWTPGD
jgi:hypothetical protein